MEWQTILEGQYEYWRPRSRRRRSRKCRVRSRGGNRRSEGLSPALSQPHAWLQLLLIVIAVQTRLPAASNTSCFISGARAHTHTLTDNPKPVGLCCSALWHPVIFLSYDKTAAVLIGLCSPWSVTAQSLFKSRHHIVRMDLSLLSLRSSFCQYSLPLFAVFCFTPFI